MPRHSFAIAPAGCVALDVGASTGGFTEVLLRRGARRVHAVDVDEMYNAHEYKPKVNLIWAVQEK